MVVRVGETYTKAMEKEYQGVDDFMDFEDLLKAVSYTACHRELVEYNEPGRRNETDRTDSSQMVPEEIDLPSVINGFFSQTINPQGESVSGLGSDFVSLSNAFDQQLVSSFLSIPSATNSIPADVSASTTDAISDDIFFSEIGLDPISEAANIPETVRMLCNASHAESRDDGPLVQTPTTSLAVDHLDQQATLGESVRDIEDLWKAPTSVAVLESPVKQKLRNSIEQRYGDMPLPAVDFAPKPLAELSPEEKVKVERRKQKNRDSAAKSRMNQKKKEKVLEKRIRELERQNDILSKEIRKYHSRKEAITHILKDHKRNCDLQAKTKKKKLALALSAFFSKIG